MVAEAILVHKAREGNADLIANAPTDIAVLVAEVERLQEAILSHKNARMQFDFHGNNPEDLELWEVIS